MVNYPVFPVGTCLTDLPEKFGIGYPFLHNVFTKRGDSIQFSYHYAKQIPGVNSSCLPI